jgi:hypothetical protein
MWETAFRARLELVLVKRTKEPRLVRLFERGEARFWFRYWRPLLSRIAESLP